MVEQAGTSGGSSQNGKMSFSEWLPIYREDQERIQRNAEARDHQIGELAEGIARLEASVSTLVEAQKSVFGHIQRPTNWGAILTGVGLLIVGAGLLIAPINAELARHQKENEEMMTQTHIDIRQMGEMAKDIEWLKKMEDRLNNRLHRDTQQ